MPMPPVIADAALAAALASLGAPATTDALLAALSPLPPTPQAGADPRNRVRDALGRARKAGTVRQVAKGVWALPEWGIRDLDAAPGTGLKWCPACGTPKGDAGFGLRDGRPAPWCRDCRNADARTRPKARPATPEARGRQRAHQRAYNRRRREDAAVRMENALAEGLRKTLRGGKGHRRLLDLLGCTPAELRAHIEGLFEPWMSWGNYGVPEPGRRTWNVGHRVPRASFGRLDWDDPRLRECWCLANLFPQDSRENSSLGSLHEGERHRY